MGYTTQFVGTLGFASEPTAAQLARLNEIFKEDCRDHPEWNAPGLYYVDLELTHDFTGVRHDGSEKTYDLDKIVNLVTRLMRERWPDFKFTGSLSAQGEELDDRWQLLIDELGHAMRREVKIEGSICNCPNCGHKFVIEAP